MLLLGLLTVTSALTTAVPASAAVSAACSLAQNGSFESPNIQDPDNPTAGDAYINGFNMFRTGQPTMSGWSTIAGTVDVLRYYNNASDGDQSIDLWGTAPATMEQTFTGLIPGSQYTFSIDYSGLEAGASSGAVLLSQGGPFTSLATLSPSVDAVSNGTNGVPQTRAYTVTWSTYTHTFTATGTSATIQLQNQAAPATQNTGLFVDNFRFGSDSPCEDFGDAPTGTLQADGGPSHIVSGFDSATGTAPLMLGATIDREDDGQPTAAADGDGADEDGITGPITLNPGATSATLPVSVTNTSGTAATLYGWIDANNDGSFLANEFTSVAVPAGATTVSLAFSGLTAFQDGITPSVRLRLTTDQLLDDTNTPAVDERALGSASNGEVEDYLARVATLVPVSCLAPFVENFGTGTGYGPPLPEGQTTYLYEGSAAVQDGEYGLLSALPGNAGGWWHNASDHTVGDTNGRLMLINASLTPGLFFQRTFTGLVPGTNYDFAAWITNANNAGSPILPNVTFRVVDPATGAVLSQVDTGNIAATSSLEWERFALQFEASQATMRLELMNNAPGGSGNDLAIDDISFMPTCEFGDAPDSYGTLISSDGAAHTSNGPTLGTLRDIEPDGQPGAAADLDGTDEDGVAGPIVITRGQTSTVSVSATNDSNADVTLAGWIDLNGDGAFQTGERVTATVPANSGTNSYQLSFPAGTTATNTYARFRIFGEVLADPQPTGSASAGEVEDYAVTVLNPALSVGKTSDATADTRPGDKVTYTVTVTNTGTGNYTADAPARAVDDLTGVLDDATFNDDADVTRGQLSYTAPALNWSGPLTVGQSATITYSVTVTNDGDHALSNTAQAVCTPPEICDPVNVITLLPHVVPSKSSDPATGTAVNAGQVLTYTLSFTNDGQAAGPVDSTDNLAGVLDDAAVTSEPVSSVPAVTAVRTGDQIRTTGQIQPGQTVTVTYQVTINPDGERGNNVARNVLTPDVPPCLVAADCPPPVTEHLIGELDAWKSVDPASGTTVQPGRAMTYTLHFQNTGTAEVSVNKDDVLTQVLDDATITAAPASSDPALTVAPVADGRFTVTGSLTPGQLVTVTYTVTVNPDGQRGDDRLGNFLVGQGAVPPAECVPANQERPDCTISYVSNIVVTKTADPGSGTKVMAGQDVTYTVTFTNTSTNEEAPDAGIAYTDHMKDVLDDATLKTGPTTTNGVTATTSGETIAFTGALASGDTAEVTYTVTVKPYAEGVNHTLGNVVAATGEEPICAADSPLCTNNPVDPPIVPVIPPAADLADTGAQAIGGLLLLGTLLLAAGGSLIFIRRRKAAQEEEGALL